MKSILIDCETTGLLLPSVANEDQQPRIIELGALLCDGEDVVAELSQLLWPGFYISEEITKITGIKVDQTIGQPTFAEYLPSLTKFFLIDGAPNADFLIAHNAPFDVGMLTYELAKLGCEKLFPWPTETLCTAAEYAPLFGFNPRMVDLYAKVMGRPLEQKHRALDDCRDLYDILKKDEFFKKIGAVD